jgi:CRP-like cAMP-binding protein
MQINSLIEPLLDISLFHGLKPLQITEIARRADRVVFRPGDIVVAENAPADAAILIVSGDAERTGAIMGPGTLLGELAMLIETGYQSTVIARTPIRAIRISRSALTGQMQEDPALAAHFAQKMSARLDAFLGELRQIDSLLAPDKALAAASEADASAGAAPAAGADETIPVTAAA